jgi:hypothetical protein
MVASTKACDEIVEQVLNVFKGRDLGEASWVCGMSITRDKTAKTIELSQDRMIENCVDRFGMQKQKKHLDTYGCKHGSMPRST